MISNETKLLQMIADNSKNERLVNVKESAQETEAKAAKQRELMPYENRIVQFREMLAEKKVRRT